MKVLAVGGVLCYLSEQGRLPARRNSRLQAAVRPARNARDTSVLEAGTFSAAKGAIQGTIRTMRIFAETDASKALEERFDEAVKEIDSRNETFLANIDDEEYVHQILTSVRIEPVVFGFDAAYITQHESMIRSEDHPAASFFIHPGRSFQRQVIRYHVPFTGDAHLLKCKPRRFVMWTRDVDVHQGEISFDVVNWSGDPADVKREENEVLGYIRQQNEHLTEQVSEFNASAQTRITQLLANRKEKLSKDRGFVNALGLPVKTHEKHQGEPRPPRPGYKERAATAARLSWDVFISHASEDKEAFVRELAEALKIQGLRVWYDEFTLKLGDSLRRLIDKGLSGSRHGIVVLSPSFFAKEWPQRELDGLVAKEVPSAKSILPIWHNVTRDDVAEHSPILADRVAISSDKGVEQVVTKILEVTGSERS